MVKKIGVFFYLTIKKSWNKNFLNTQKIQKNAY